MNSGAAVAHRPKFRNSALAPALVILLLAAFLRLAALERQPLRGDEAFAYYNYSARSAGEWLREIAPIEPLPPGQYALFRAWHLLVGADEIWSMRLMPALFSLVGVAAAYATAAQLGGRRFALLTALHYGALPALLWHAQDARNYAPWLAMSALALALGLRWLRSARINWRDGMRYALAAAAALLLAYQEAAPLLALMAFALLSRYREWRNGELRRLLALQAALLAAAAGIFLALHGGLLRGGYGGNLAHFSLSALLELPAQLVYGDLLPIAWAPVAGAALWLLAAAVFYALWRGERHQRALRLAILLLLLPILLMSLAALPWRVFGARYLAASALGLALLAAAALDAALHDRRPRATLLALSALALSFTLALAEYHGPFRKAVDWRQLLGWMGELLSPADALIHPSHDPAFSWHLARAGTGAEERWLPAGPQQSRAEIEASLAALSAEHAALWLVGREYGDWPNADISEAWLESERQRWLRGETGGIPYAAYLPVAVPPAEIAAAAPFVERAVFGDPPLVAAKGYALTRTPNALVLRLYWQPLRRSESPLTAFIHLARAGEARPLAQADRQPRHASDRWPVGALQREIHALDVTELPAGEYELRFGWYDAATGARLPIPGAGDALTITDIQLP